MATTMGIAESDKSTLARKIFPRHVHVSLDAIKKWGYAQLQIMSQDAV